MNHAKYFIILLSATFLLSNCKKDNPIPAADLDVYIAGSPGFLDGPATYSKNGVPVILCDSGGATNAIVVKGADVYVAGYAYRYRPKEYYPINGSLAGPDTTPKIGTYWKNGIPTSLGRNTICTSIAVVGNDIYAAGYSYITDSLNNGFAQGGNLDRNHTGIYWKNGVPTSLGSNTYCAGIAVMGNDVYVAGSINGTAVYWKNGVPNKLAGTSPSAANAITINNDDVYIAGTTNSNDNAVYWKNGSLIQLAESGSSANAITVSGSDIYVGGRYTTEAVYWRNKIIKVLPNLGSTANDVTSIATNGTDVYSVGYSGLSVAAWKNMQIVTSRNSGSFSSIVLAKRQ